MFYRLNVRKVMSESSDAGSNMLVQIAEDKCMTMVTQSYDQYVADKQREEELNGPPEESETPVREPPTSEARPTGVFGKREEPEEEKKEESKEEVKDPTELDLLIEEMEEDQTLIETLENTKEPLSHAYNAIDAFNPANVLSRSPCTERVMGKRDPCVETEQRLKKALTDNGFKSADLDKMFEGREIPDSMAAAYKGLVRAVIKQKKEKEDFEKGRWTKIEGLE